MAVKAYPLHLLQSAEHLQLLNDVDKLRSDGVQHHDIDLPQLLVCGDRGSGKASVLEALSGIKVPFGTSIYTPCVMELALRRSPAKKATAKILPGRKASTDRQQQLKDFKPPEVDLAGVPELIEKAWGVMGLTDHHATCDDVLRLEITGPDLTHLTLLDLPELMTDGKDPGEIGSVEKMVRRYMKNPRSIILAIVSAKNDKQDQKVLQLAREFDLFGVRTFGIITMSDMLKHPRGSVAEQTFLDMAKNQGPLSKLRLGWHVVRDLDNQEEPEHSTYGKDETEREIFSEQPWNELSRSQFGIGSLREELTKHLFNQICSELPNVLREIECAETKCEQELKDLGVVRVKSKDQRKYLIGISRRFEQLVGAGLEGHWISDPIFNVDGMRLRAQIRKLNDEFEKTMMQNGHTFEFVPGERHRRKEPLPPFSFNNEPLIQNQAHLLRKADKIIKSGRGQELPGMCDPILVSDVFRDQSQKWQNLLHQHVEKVWDITNHFLRKLLFEIAPARTTTAEAVLDEIVSVEMLQRKRSLDAKIAELLLPYEKSLPFWTASRMATSLKQVDLGDENTERGLRPNSDVIKLVGDGVDIDACSTLMRYSQAYYNIARDTVIDTVATLAIENCLLNGLASIFSSDKILDMDDSQLSNLAWESDEAFSSRNHMEEKNRLLKRSVETCKIHMYRRLILREDFQKDLAQERGGISLVFDPVPPQNVSFGSPVGLPKDFVPRKSRSPLGAKREDHPQLARFEPAPVSSGSALFSGLGGGMPKSSSPGLFATPAPAGSGSAVFSGLVGGVPKSSSPGLSATPAPVGSGSAVFSGLVGGMPKSSSPGLFTTPTHSHTSSGSVTLLDQGGLGQSSQSDPSAVGAQKGSLGSGSVALAPTIAVQDDIPGRQSPGATPKAPSTSRAATPTPPSPQPSFGKALGSEKPS